MANTTIPVKPDLKDELAEDKQEHETWNHYLKRLSKADERLTESDVRAIVSDMVIMEALE